MGVGAGLYMCDVVKKKFTFAISSPDMTYNFYYLVAASRAVKHLGNHAR